MPDAAQPFRKDLTIGVHEGVIAHTHLELRRIIAEMERLGLSEVALRGRLTHIAETLHPEAVRRLVDETWAKSPYAKRAPRSGVLVDLYGGRQA